MIFRQEKISLRPAACIVLPGKSTEVIGGKLRKAGAGCRWRIRSQFRAGKRREFTSSDHVGRHFRRGGNFQHRLFQGLRLGLIETQRALRNGPQSVG